MTLRAGRIVVDAADVVASGEVDVVVAAAAGSYVLDFTPVAGLRCIRVGLVMAGRAVTHILREYDVRIIVYGTAVTNDEVTIGEVYAEVNLVDHLLHVDRTAPGFGHGVAIDRRRIVAGDAVVDIRAWPTVEVDDVVAGEAGVIVDDAAFEYRVAAGRHKIVNAVRGDRSLATNLDAEAMRFGFVVNGPRRISGQVVSERVGVRAITIVNKRPCCGGLSICLGIRNPGAVTCDVGLPLTRSTARARGELCQREADFTGSQAEETLCQVIGQCQLNNGCTAASRYGNARDFNINQVDRINRNAIGWSSRSRGARRSGRTGVTVIALRAFVAGACSERDAEH